MWLSEIGQFGVDLRRGDAEGGADPRLSNGAQITQQLVDIGAEPLQSVRELLVRAPICSSRPSRSSRSGPTLSGLRLSSARRAEERADEGHRMVRSPSHSA